MQRATAKLITRVGYWGCLLSMILCAHHSLHAQSQQVSCVVTTRGGASEMLDVTFLIECGSSEASGALHYHVQSLAGPSPRDRELEIVFAMAHNGQGQYATTHRTKVSLKEGANSTEGVLSFAMDNATDPSGQRLQFWNVTVLEDDRDIEAARGIQTMPGAAYVPAQFAPGETPAFMLLQRASQSGAALHISENGANYAMLPTVTALGSVPGGITQESRVFDLFRDPLRVVSLRHVDSLPTIWFYYLQFRYVALTSDTLAQIRAQKPGAAEALKQYVASGGSIVVISPEDSDETSLDQWLSNKTGEQEKSTNSVWERSFPTVKFPLFGPKKTSEDSTDAEPVVDDPPEVTPDETQQRTVWRSYLRGRVYSVKGRLGQMSAKFMTALPSSTGLAASNVYDEGWPLRNMIASVGKPPVWTFCAIILLFGIVLGPGLLILTGWIGRRSLLILLVPLVSLGATLAIVSYEVLHEGFGTYARVTSVVNIDAESGEAFAWSRQTYFSGWPPREGLSVPDNVYCRLVNSHAMARMGYYRGLPSNQYNVQHLADKHVWTGVLPAREQRQFLIGHSLKATMPIKIIPMDGQKVIVRNQTSSELPFVVLRDGKDGFYFGEQVPANGEIELSSQLFDDIAGSLSRMRSEYMPTLPPDVRSLGWAFSQSLGNVEVLDQSWSGALAEQSMSSSIKPYGFVVLMRSSEGIYVPLKTDSQEELTLVTGRAVW